MTACKGGGSCVVGGGIFTAMGVGLGGIEAAGGDAGFAIHSASDIFAPNVTLSSLTEPELDARGFAGVTGAPGCEPSQQNTTTKGMTQPATCRVEGKEHASYSQGCGGWGWLSGSSNDFRGRDRAGEFADRLCCAPVL